MGWRAKGLKYSWKPFFLSLVKLMWVNDRILEESFVFWGRFIFPHPEQGALNLSYASVNILYFFHWKMIWRSRIVIVLKNSDHRNVFRSRRNVHLAWKLLFSIRHVYGCSSTTIIIYEQVTFVFYSNLLIEFKGEVLILFVLDLLLMEHWRDGEAFGTLSFRGLWILFPY